MVRPANGLCLADSPRQRPRYPKAHARREITAGCWVGALRFNTSSKQADPVNDFENFSKKRIVRESIVTGEGRAEQDPARSAQVADGRHPRPAAAALADEDTLDRVLWHAARGRDDTYPAWAVLPEEDREDEDDETK